MVHCKAGKGRSGTVACSYLVSEEGWTQEDALTRFTRRRMRSGFGSGVSIPSQLRWLGYVDWWSKHGKVYVERQIEILEVHVWGLRDGVKVAVEGYIEEGRVRKTFHTFGRSEKTVMEGEHNIARPTNAFDHFNEDNLPIHESNPQAAPNQPDFAPLRPAEISHEPGGNAVLFRPDQPTVLPTSDINIDFERRNKASYGLTMVTSVAHVWFNAFFESQTSLTSPNNATEPSNVHHLADSGVFEIDWEAMDGIKGSARKGTRALDRLAVLWRAVPETQQGLNNVIITEPGVGERVPESRAADWQNANIRAVAANFGKDLGLRAESSTSANVSKASSATDLSTRSLPTIRHDESGLEAGVEACGLGGEKDIPLPTITTSSTTSLPTIGRDEGCLEAGVKACGLHGEEHISQPTITTLEPSSLDYRSIDIEKKANSEVGLGMQKVHSPTASPGLKAISKDPLTSPEQISG